MIGGGPLEGVWRGPIYPIDCLCNSLSHHRSSVQFQDMSILSISLCRPQRVRKTYAVKCRANGDCTLRPPVGNNNGQEADTFLSDTLLLLGNHGHLGGRIG